MPSILMPNGYFGYLSYHRIFFKNDYFLKHSFFDHYFPINMYEILKCNRYPWYIAPKKDCNEICDECIYADGYCPYDEDDERTK